MVRMIERRNPRMAHQSTQDVGALLQKLLTFCGILFTSTRGYHKYSYKAMAVDPRDFYGGNTETARREEEERG